MPHYLSVMFSKLNTGWKDLELRSINQPTSSNVKEEVIEDKALRDVTREHSSYLAIVIKTDHSMRAILLSLLICNSEKRNNTIGKILSGIRSIIFYLILILIH
jgi:hypothetical protein